jgi:hypothetical protein
MGVVAVSGETRPLPRGYGPAAPEPEEGPWCVGCRREKLTGNDGLCDACAAQEAGKALARQREAARQRTDTRAGWGSARR